MPAKILIVDDDPAFRQLLVLALEPAGAELVEADSGAAALAVTREQEFGLAILDYRMPGMNGCELAEKLRNQDQTRRLPIIFLTGDAGDQALEFRGYETGAVDFIGKTTNLKVLLSKVKVFLELHEHKTKLENAVANRTAQLVAALKKLRIASLDTINRLSAAAEYKDEDTGSHIVRMSLYAVVLARQLGLNEATIEKISYAAPMHDIGKIGIPDRILLKPGKLDAEEWKIMQEHTTIGAHILTGSDSDFIRMGETIALTHHERWDGGGYPAGLKGDAIPIEGRIVAVADVFDALTSRRPYKDAFPIDKACAIICDGRGSQFDPAVVDAFEAVREEVVRIRRENVDD
jgi:putative two-component system response regulator